MVLQINSMGILDLWDQETSLLTDSNLICNQDLVRLFFFVERREGKVITNFVSFFEGFDDMMSPMGSGPPPPMPPQGFDPMGGPPPPHMVQGPGGQFEGMFDDFGGNQDFYNMQ